MAAAATGERTRRSPLPPNLFRKPAVDTERIPIEPELHWIDSAITPFTRTTSGVYDIANRCWYELSVDHVVTDQDWIVSEVRRHISSPPDRPFNSISIGQNGEVTFAFKTNISRAISNMATYDGLIPQTSLRSIRDRKYLSGPVDTCQWNSRKVAYKCVEFLDDVKPMFREIRVREQLAPDYTGVAPILAVAIWPETEYVDGIVLPLYQTDMESFAKDPRARLSLSALHRLIQTIARFQSIGITHGDICERNLVLNMTDDCRCEDLVLVDFGEVAPEYQGDMNMAAELLLWCATHFTWLEEEKRTVVIAAGKIQAGDYGDALDMLAGR